MIRSLILCCAIITGSVAADAPPSPPQGYRLYPGDVLGLKVYGHDDLSFNSLRVPTHGQLRFPLIGAVDVVGRTPDELADELQRRWADGFIRDPLVSVVVAEFGARSASVVGNVHKPGELALTPLAATSVLQALGRAGGMLENANRAAVVVVRRTVDGQREFIPVPPPDQIDAAEEILLEPGDVVIVPPLDRAFVIGQVQRGGPVLIPAVEPMTVSKAISLSGGFDRFARQSEVQLIRNGARIATVDVRAVLNGVAGAVDPRLQPGDTIFVPESRF